MIIFHSSLLVGSLANGGTCLVVGWWGLVCKVLRHASYFFLAFYVAAYMFLVLGLDFVWDFWALFL
ncbi:hypothetical protein, partial [Stenotrophomonas maltophilia]|uniref:hypothetical protein n=1 Tax=Stenotrophomonas maltophilia TaxID=40324 RepID=UPI003D08607F